MKRRRSSKRLEEKQLDNFLGPLLSKNLSQKDEEEILRGIAEQLSQKEKEELEKEVNLDELASEVDNLNKGKGKKTRRKKPKTPKSKKPKRPKSKRRGRPRK